MDKVKIHYLYHDGFIVETKSHILIFDYYNNKSTNDNRHLNAGVIPDEIFNTDKTVYVFVSHSHEDHFNPLIFNWKNINTKIEYILSSDIEVKATYPEHRIISEGDTIQFNDVSIKAYGSTDAGVSFLVNIDGITMFHAGDLNWWHWYDESDEDNLNMAKAFKSQIAKLKDESIDIAFFPVDPRLKDYYYLGGEYFIESLSPKMFIPMHFWKYCEVTLSFAEKLKDYNTNIVVIKNRGQEILFS
jgi:L-ascorbate metabolism protein UlaG (beta-lactamase superfamily)